MSLKSPFVEQCSLSVHRMAFRLAMYGALVLCSGCAIFDVGDRHLVEDVSQASHEEFPGSGVSGPDVVPADESLLESEIPRLPPEAATKSGEQGKELSPGEMGSVRRLTLVDATQAALMHNEHLQAVRFIPEAARTRIDTELAVFDPVIQAGGQWTDANQQVQSAIQAAGLNGGTLQTTSIGGFNGRPNQLELRKKWNTGTVTRMGYGTNYNYNSPAGQFLLVNPAYQSALNFTVEQPLFQGMGSTANLLAMQVAQMTHQQSIEELRTEINNVLLATHVAYWDAFRAQSEIANIEEIVQEAERTWRKEARRVEIGDGSTLDAAQARENYETLRVELEKSRRRAGEAKNQLRQLLGVSCDDRRDFEFTETPCVDRLVFNLDTATHLALRQRPELEAQRRAVLAASLERDRLAQVLRPALMATAGYALTGLSDGIGGSLSNVATGQYGNWNMGLTYQHAFGRRAEKAALEQAEYVVGRQRAALKEQEGKVTHEVLEAHDSVAASFEVLTSQHLRLDAAQLQFDTQKRLYESGGLPLDPYVRAVSAYVHARREVHQAVMEYNVALARWAYVIGAYAPLAEGELESGSIPDPNLFASDQH